MATTWPVLEAAGCSSCPVACRDIRQRKVTHDRWNLDQRMPGSRRGATILYIHCSDGAARCRQGGGDGFGICAADDPLIPRGTLQAHPHAAGRIAMDCDEHLLAMAADSGHSGDAGDAHPELDPDPDPGPAVGIVEHLDAAKRRQRHMKVAVNCLGLLRTR